MDCDCNGGMVCGTCLKDCDDYRHMVEGDRVWLRLTYCPKWCEKMKAFEREVGNGERPFQLELLKAGTIYQDAIKYGGK